MRRFFTGILIFHFLLSDHLLFAQATQLGTEMANGTYTSYGLTDMGLFRQARVQATSSATAGSRNWEFYEAPADYDPAWRPYSCCLTLAGYNQTISPLGGTASALYNLGFGGNAGYMPAITSGNYYSFNITEYSTGAFPANEFMSVLETNYDPVAITSVVQSPLAAAVYPENSVYVTVTVSAAPSAGEYVYVRYASDINFTSSSLLQVTFTGTSGTVEIPCATSGTTIYYYAYSSPRTSAAITTGVGTYGQVVHDMSTLNLNNNGGPNYTYTVLPSVGFCGDYYVPSSCYPTISDFVNALNGGSVSCAVICHVAAGHTETAPLGGINLTQTGTAANTITFVKEGAGANPVIYAPIGTVSPTTSSTVVDGVFSLNGSDYVTIDGIDITDNNTTAPATMEYGYGLFKGSASDGCQHNTIQNCTITLKSSNNWTNSPATFLETGSRGITMNNGVRTAINVTLSISTNAGRNESNAFLSNYITNVYTGIVVGGYGDATPPYTYYDQNNMIGQPGQGNTITHWGGNTTRACGIYCIYQNGIDIAGNTINNTADGGTPQLSTLYGIFHSGFTGSQTIDLTIRENTISMVQGAPASQFNGITTGSSGYSAGNVNILDNIIENCAFLREQMEYFMALGRVLPQLTQLFPETRYAITA
ncbi:MAG: hypothetical protein R2794_02515 [Chitinophagales bacterium]